MPGSWYHSLQLYAKTYFSTIIISFVVSKSTHPTQLFTKIYMETRTCKRSYSLEFQKFVLLTFILTALCYFILNEQHNTGRL